MSSELGTPVGGTSVQDRRAVLAAARVAIDGLAGLLWQVTGPELAQLVEELDALSCAAGGAVVAVVAEADARGEIAASQAGTSAQWVARHAPSLAAEGAGQVARLVQECRRPELAPVRDAVERGRLPVGVGLTVVAEFRWAPNTVEWVFVGCDRRCWPGSVTPGCSKRCRTPPDGSSP